MTQPKPRVTRTLLDVFETVDGHRCEVDHENLLATVPRRVAGRATQHVVSFPATPFVRRILHHIVTIGPVSLAGSLANTVIGLGEHARHMELEGRDKWSAEAFAEWLTAMRASDFKEATQRGYASMVLTFLEGPFLSAADTDRASVLSARLRYRRRFQGFSRRALETLHQNAITAEEYLRLIRAARLELEELRSRNAGQVPALAPDGVFPYAPFIVLAGAVMAVRASELNVMEEGDIRSFDEALWWNLHAPNKEHAQIPVHEAVVDALRTAREWDATHDRARGPNEPLLTTLNRMGEVVRLDSIHMRGILYLFAQKWFGRTDHNGRRVLWRGPAESDARPFFIAPAHLRIAAISEWARRERNPEKLRILARHRSLQTTERFYIKQAQEDYHADWANATRVDSELLRASMSGRVATAEQQRIAGEVGALLEGGHCQEVLEGIVGCERATDCRRCKNFRIHADQRAVFVVALESARGRAQRAADEGLIRQAENYRGMVALNQAVIDRIDEYHADEEDAE